MATIGRALYAAQSLIQGKIFYGWYIVVLAFLSMFISVGVQAFSFAVFLKPMTQELGWSRGEFSAAQSISTVVMAATSMIIGGLVDRHGGRWLMITGAGVLGASAISLSHVTELWQFYIIRGVFFIVGSACTGNLVVNITLSKWFVRRRGKAMAWASMGIPLGGLAMVPLTTWLIEELGWRSAWVVLGILVWAVLVIPAALIMRRQPEDMRLLPDGDAAIVPGGTERTEGIRHRLSAATEEQWTFREAVRTSTMWLLIVGWGISMLGSSGLLLHLLPFLTDHGFSQGTAALIFSVALLGSAICKPFWGHLADIVHPRFLTAASFAITGTAILMILHMADTGSALAMLVFIGLWNAGVGANPPLGDTVWASYFGRRHIGAIRGIAMPLTQGFGAMGPLLAGYLFESSGGYTLPFTIFALSAYAGILFMLLARRPRRAPTPGTLPVSANS